MTFVIELVDTPQSLMNAERKTSHVDNMLLFPLTFELCDDAGRKWYKCAIIVVDSILSSMAKPARLQTMLWVTPSQR
jgi:hypothetical protein